MFQHSKRGWNATLTLCDYITRSPKYEWFSKERGLTPPSHERLESLGRMHSLSIINCYTVVCTAHWRTFWNFCCCWSAAAATGCPMEVQVSWRRRWVVGGQRGEEEWEIFWAGRTVSGTEASAYACILSPCPSFLLYLDILQQNSWHNSKETLWASGDLPQSKGTNVSLP